MGTSTWPDIARALYASASSDEARAAVFEMAMDMLTELEAMRKALATCPTTRPYYRQAYEDTTALAHDASGPMGGMGKLLLRFYPLDATEEDSGERRNWREALLMRRLGLTEDEIEAFKETARETEMYT